MQIFLNTNVTENKSYESRGLCNLYFNICFMKYEDGIHMSQGNRQTVKLKYLCN